MVFSTGCVDHSSADVNPPINLSSLKTVHVTRYPSDNTKVNEEIVDKLRLKGVRVNTGETLTTRGCKILIVSDAEPFDSMHSEPHRRDTHSFGGVERGIAHHAFE
jgi:hypothetical protein